MTPVCCLCVLLLLWEWCFGIKGNKTASQILITGCTKKKFNCKVLQCVNQLRRGWGWRVEDKSCSKCQNAMERCVKGFLSCLIKPQKQNSLLKLKLLTIPFSNNIWRTTQRFRGFLLTSHDCVAGCKISFSKDRECPFLTSYDFFFPWSHDIFHWDQGAVVKKGIKDIPFLACSELSRRTHTLLLTTIISWGVLITLYAPFFPGRRKQDRMSVHCSPSRKWP